MIAQILHELITFDHELFLYLNSLGNETWDSTMIFITGKWSWVPFYLLIIAGLMYRFRKKTIPILVAIALTITISDRFSSGFMKPTIKRLRPCQNAELQENTRVLVHCGRYGFISSHASNTFALAFLLTFIFRRQKYVRVLGLGLFLWAFIVSYSRIYVGLHYPADIFFGAFAGIFWAFLVCKIAEQRKVIPFYQAKI